jgi:hypothetical protein
VDYWPLIAERYRLNLEVINPKVDYQFGFMSLDWDGKIRMDCSSPFAMASLIENKTNYDISTGNDADADRHGIVTSDSGLMNPNHFLVASIDYLFRARDGWDEESAVGKTMVSSSLIDRVVEAAGRNLLEVPVGFKWFVAGLSNGSLGFGGEESAGASFLRLNGQPWSTDKDGLIMCLLAAEIEAVTGSSPSERYAEIAREFGEPHYRRVDAPANLSQKALLAKGHALYILTRNPTQNEDSLTYIHWNGHEVPALHAHMNAVINLCGASIASDTWTDERQKILLESRVQPTLAMLRYMEGLSKKPDVFLNASAVGFYGDRQFDLLTEQSTTGKGYLAELSQAWEKAAHNSLTRTVLLRTGIVLSPKGGAL